MKNHIVILFLILGVIPNALATNCGPKIADLSSLAPKSGLYFVKTFSESLKYKLLKNFMWHGSDITFAFTDLLGPQVVSGSVSAISEPNGLSHVSLKEEGIITSVKVSQITSIMVR